jgi:hypothetical protein
LSRSSKQRPRRESTRRGTAASSTSSLVCDRILPIDRTKRVASEARGRLADVPALLEELRPLALASGEPRRIIPMAGAVMPLLAVTNRLEELR